MSEREDQGDGTTPAKPCQVDECTAFAHARGMCSVHYGRVRRHGSTDPLVRLRGIELFWSKVEKTDDCWIWNGQRQKEGDGRWYSQKVLTASGTRLCHRIAYEVLVGPIPKGLHLDHLCRRPECVNPAHLEPVTAAENTRRGLHGRLRTHCSHGHELTEESVYLREADGSRRCRECARLAVAAKRATEPKREHRWHVKDRDACGTLQGTSSGVELHRAAGQPVCALCNVIRKRQNRQAWRDRQKEKS